MSVRGVCALLWKCGYFCPNNSVCLGVKGPIVIFLHICHAYVVGGEFEDEVCSSVFVLGNGIVYDAGCVRSAWFGGLSHGRGNAGGTGPHA